MGKTLGLMVQWFSGPMVSHLFQNRPCVSKHMFNSSKSSRCFFSQFTHICSQVTEMKCTKISGTNQIAFPYENLGFDKTPLGYAIILPMAHITQLDVWISDFHMGNQLFNGSIQSWFASVISGQISTPLSGI